MATMVTKKVEKVKVLAKDPREAAITPGLMCGNPWAGIDSFDKLPSGKRRKMRHWRHIGDGEGSASPEGFCGQGSWLHKGGSTWKLQSQTLARMAMRRVRGASSR